MSITTSQTIQRLKEQGAVYERLGIRPIINGNGTQTTLGGSIMDPETAQAMHDASRTMVVIEELNQKAGEIIAEHTGAESGIVTAGAAAALLVQAAAVIAGLDPERIFRLPDTTEMPNEIVIKRSHHSEFTQSWREAGAELVWVGGDDDEIEAGISEQTVALGFIASRWNPDSFEGLDSMIRIAHRYSLPVLVDAAAMLPPAENLRRFIDHGADLVVYSGGKAIRGPQSTGILCGRQELVVAAAANNSPNHAIGRPAKVAREEIVGLVVALERYVQRDHEAEMQTWHDQAQIIADTVSTASGVKAMIVQDDWVRPVPEVSISFTSQFSGRTAHQIVEDLAKGDPAIIIEASRRADEDIFVNPINLMPGEEELLAQRLLAAMVR
ncbi:MAG: aminotransferase class V-fold PLP-dependent enzyme [SAR202 cluster bacterium]|nr:aminotransferase class V-fold PLP-dependent enzyme [SAR202 cluster bacterium]